jgi:hypothetical protein
VVRKSVRRMDLPPADEIRSFLWRWAKRSRLSGPSRQEHTPGG